MKAIETLCIDRENIRQSMEIINIMTEEVKKGRNFAIFFIFYVANSIFLDIYLMHT